MRGAKLTGFRARDGGAVVWATISGTEALAGAIDPLLNTPFTHLEGTQEVSKSELSIYLANPGYPALMIPRHPSSILIACPI